LPIEYEILQAYLQATEVEGEPFPVAELFGGNWNKKISMNFIFVF
jgi:hypothetical protein